MSSTNFRRRHIPLGERLEAAERIRAGRASLEEVAAAHGVDAADDLELREQTAIQAAVDRVAPSIVSIETVGGLERVDRVLVGNGPTTGFLLVNRARSRAMTSDARLASRIIRRAALRAPSILSGSSVSIRSQTAALVMMPAMAPNAPSCSSLAASQVPS